MRYHPKFLFQTQSQFHPLETDITLLLILRCTSEMKKILLPILKTPLLQALNQLWAQQAAEQK